MEGKSASGGDGESLRGLLQIGCTQGRREQPRAIYKLAHLIPTSSGNADVNLEIPTLSGKGCSKL